MNLVSPENFKTQFGGLHIAVQPYNNADLIHRGMLGDILRETIRHEAKVHGSAFNESGFDKVMQVLSGGKVMEALFFIAAWDVSKLKIVGAATIFPTVTIDESGAAYGKYSEDVCLLPNKLKELLSEKPVGKFRPPGVSPGALFEQESIRYMASTSDALYRFGEVAPDNTKIHRILQEQGTVIGTGKDSAVLEFIGPTTAMFNRWQVPVSAYAPTQANGTFDPNNFTLGWRSQDGSQRINAAFTKTISTFTGETVARVFFDSKGMLPDNEATKDIVSSLLSGGREEMANPNRKWGAIESQPPMSPSIHIHGSTYDAHAASFSLNGGTMTGSKVQTVQANAPVMRINYLNEPGIHTALTEMGVPLRTLGGKAMQPAAKSLAVEQQEAKPLAVPNRPRLISTAEAISDPIYAFAA